MTGAIGNLWRWEGRVGRGRYALFGVCGVAIKHNLDRFTAAQFGYPWHAILSYWIPVIKATRLIELAADEKRFLAVLFLTTVPFLWVGVTLTVKRLRDAGQPLWLTVLFFVPVVNVVFFLLLCLMPSQEASALAQATGGRQQSGRKRAPTLPGSHAEMLRHRHRMSAG